MYYTVCVTSKTQRFLRLIVQLVKPTAVRFERRGRPRSVQGVYAFSTFFHDEDLLICFVCVSESDFSEESLSQTPPIVRPNNIALYQIHLLFAHKRNTFSSIFRSSACAHTSQCAPAAFAAAPLDSLSICESQHACCYRHRRGYAPRPHTACSSIKSESSSARHHQERY